MAASERIDKVVARPGQHTDAISSRAILDGLHVGPRTAPSSGNDMIDHSHMGIDDEPLH
jgi:hypothetical protein